MKKNLFGKPIKKEILSFFQYRQRLKIIKNNIEFRNEFQSLNSSIDKLYSIDETIIDETYKLIFNEYETIILYEINIEKEKKINFIGNFNIFNSEKTFIFINGKKTNFQHNFLLNSGKKIILLCNNEKKTLTNLEKMFFKLDFITKIYFIKINTKNVKNMQKMFYSCKKLIYIDLKLLNTSNVQNMFNIFYNCCSLKHLNLSNFDTKNLINMKSMFSLCNNLISIEFSNDFNTNSVKNMECLFLECSKLKIIKNIEKFVCNEVVDINGMFADCENIEILDLRNFNFDKIENLKEIFCGCEKLKKIIINKKYFNLFLNEVDNKNILICV